MSKILGIFVTRHKIFFFLSCISFSSFDKVSTSTQSNNSIRGFARRPQGQMNFLVGSLLFAMTTFFPMVVVLEENALENITCFLCL
jgi:hypothetical protein